MPSPNKTQKVAGPLRDPVPFVLRGKCERGFTLIEVLVSTVILASALVVIVQNLGRTQEALGISQNLVFASELGLSKLSSLELEQKEQIRLSVRRDEGREKRSGRTFEWESELTPYRDESILDETKLNQAQVMVRWQDGRKRDNKLQFMTLLLIRDKEKYETVQSP